MSAPASWDDIAGFVDCPHCATDDDETYKDFSFRIGLHQDGRHILACCAIHGPFHAFELAQPTLKEIA